MSMLETDEEKASFAEFYEVHKLKSLHIAMKITGNQPMAEDAIHNAFLEIIKRWKEFSSSPLDKNLSRFIIIVKTEAIDLMREAKRKGYADFEDEAELCADKTVDISLQIESKIEFEKLIECVLSLPEIYKTTLELRYVQDMSNNEIAKTLNITPRTVSMRIHRAKIMLRRILDLEDSEYAQ